MAGMALLKEKERCSQKGKKGAAAAAASRLSGCISRSAPHLPLSARPSFSSSQCHRAGAPAAAAATAAGTMVRRARWLRVGGRGAASQRALQGLGVRPPF